MKGLIPLLIGGAILILLFLWEISREYLCAIECPFCFPKGSGQGINDPEFDCTECSGTGAIIFKTYLSDPGKHFNVIWTKRIRIFSKGK